MQNLSHLVKQNDEYLKALAKAVEPFIKSLNTRKADIDTAWTKLSEEEKNYIKTNHTLTHFKKILNSRRSKVANEFLQDNQQLSHDLYELQSDDKIDILKNCISSEAISTHTILVILRLFKKTEQKHLTNLLKTMKEKTGDLNRITYKTRILESWVTFMKDCGSEEIYEKFVHKKIWADNEFKLQFDPGLPNYKLLETTWDNLSIEQSYFFMNFNTIEHFEAILTSQKFKIAEDFLEDNTKFKQDFFALPVGEKIKLLKRCLSSNSIKDYSFLLILSLFNKAECAALNDLLSEDLSSIVQYKVINLKSWVKFMNDCESQEQYDQFIPLKIWTSVELMPQFYSNKDQYRLFDTWISLTEEKRYFFKNFNTIEHYVLILTYNKPTIALEFLENNGKFKQDFSVLSLEKKIQLVDKSLSSSAANAMSLQLILSLFNSEEKNTIKIPKHWKINENLTTNKKFEILQAWINTIENIKPQKSVQKNTSFSLADLKTLLVSHNYNFKIAFEELLKLLSEHFPKKKTISSNDLKDFCASKNYAIFFFNLMIQKEEDINNYKTPEGEHYAKKDFVKSFVNFLKSSGKGDNVIPSSPKFFSKESTINKKRSNEEMQFDTEEPGQKKFQK